MEMVMDLQHAMTDNLPPCHALTVEYGYHMNEYTEVCTKYIFPTVHIDITLTVFLELVLDTVISLITYTLIFFYPNSLPEADGNKSAPSHWMI